MRYFLSLTSELCEESSVGTSYGLRYTKVVGDLILSYDNYLQLNLAMMDAITESKGKGFKGTEENSCREISPLLDPLLRGSTVQQNAK